MIEDATQIARILEAKWNMNGVKERGMYRSLIILPDMKSFENLNSLKD